MRPVDAARIDAAIAENRSYRLECYLWHAQGGAWASLEGYAHPPARRAIPFLGCPDCDTGSS